MRFLLIALTLVVCFTNCNNTQTSKTIKSNVSQNIETEKSIAVQIVEVDETDEEMNKAIELANQTLDKFDEALVSKNPNLTHFAIKTKFDTHKGVEHIWVNNIEIRDKKYVGTIDNLPQSIRNMRIGDEVIIEKNTISDWMFAENNKLRGGYTIKLLRKRMTESERKKFDDGNTIFFED